MKQILKSLIPTSAILKRREKVNQAIIEEWEKNGKPVPPPHAIKQRTIQEYGEKYNCKLLVETGTFMGDMVEAMKHLFDQVITIELSEDLYHKAVLRFKRDKNITVKQGDSGEVLPSITKELNQPTLFWLDGHYSSGITAQGEKDCPIYKELDAVFENKELDHVLLIDDARDFVGKNDYPTLDELEQYIHSKDPSYHFVVKDDIIRCHK